VIHLNLDELKREYTRPCEETGRVPGSASRVPAQVQVD